MDNFGDRIKLYERFETDRKFIPLLPIYARIDGRNFHKFTKGMERPFDPKFHACMVETTIKLVQETGALVGYTQSDEISLLWYSPNMKSQIFFNGKISKIISVSASLATSYFIECAMPHWPNKFSGLSFDCRSFQLPNKKEAANAFLWREQDATKNAISMAARTLYSHNELQGVSSSEMQEMMFKKGVNFNDYPNPFKRGTFVLRRTIMKNLGKETLAKIPVEKRPNGPIARKIVIPINMPKFSTVTNRVNVLFSNELPKVV